MKNINQKAWQIRREIAKRSGKPLMQVSWKTAYGLAYRLSNPKVRYMSSPSTESHFLPKEKPSKGIIRKALATLATLI